MMKRLLCLLTLCFALALSGRAAPVASLITCGPSGEYVFTLYGHTAIRITDPEEGYDLAYNYGDFDMQQKHFITNFIIGKPMYRLGVVDFDALFYTYAAEGRSIVEQQLQMSTEEVEALKAYLDHNALPENAEYQYNYFFDNCATRPRDLIERFAGGELIYKVDPVSLPTFREGARQCSQSNRWYTFGADLCLGVKSDQQMTVRDAAYLPALLEQSMDLAYRSDTGEAVVAAKRELAPQTQILKAPRFDGPLVTILGLCLLYLLLFFVVRPHTAIPWRLLRTTLYVVMGLAGVVLWFISFISVHPHTFFNANTVLLHPFWILLAVTIWQSGRHVRTLNRWLYGINLLLALVYLGLGYMQRLPVGMAYLAILVGFDQWIGLYLLAKERKRA